MENLSYKLTTYTIMGLDPGDRFRVELGTVTGNVETRCPIEDVILTHPKQVSGLTLSEITHNSLVIGEQHAAIFLNFEMGLKLPAPAPEVELQIRF